MRPVLKGSTDQSVVIRIVDSTDGTPEEAVEHNSAGIALWYRREGGLKVAITPAALTALDDAHSDGGIEHIDDGYYRLDVPDAAFAGGANGVMIGGAVTGMIVIGCYVPLEAVNRQDAVRMGLTALPNANADAAGGLPVSDAGGLDLDAALSGNTPQTGDAYARLGAPAGASVSADVAAVKSDTGAILDDTGTSGVKVAADQSGVTIGTVNALGTQAKADVNAEVDSALDTAIPGSPTAGSVNERLKTMDDADLPGGQTVIAGAVASLNDPTAAAVADAVWDEAKAGHVGAGSFGEEVQAHALTSDVPTAAQNADKLLGRNIAGGADGGRTVTSAFRGVRNKVSISGGVLTVYQEDDTTVAWTAAVTTTPGDPVSEVDPA